MRFLKGFWGSFFVYLSQRSPLLRHKSLPPHWKEIRIPPPVGNPPLQPRTVPMCAFLPMGIADSKSCLLFYVVRNLQGLLLFFGNLTVVAFVGNLTTCKIIVGTLTPRHLEGNMEKVVALL